MGTAVIPVRLKENLSPVIDNVRVNSISCVALIDTGATNSWIKPRIGDNLQPYALGDETEAVLPSGEVTVAGFDKLRGKPVEGHVQLRPELGLYRQMLMSGEFDSPEDMIIGMDILLTFSASVLTFAGVQGTHNLTLTEP